MKTHSATVQLSCMGVKAKDLEPGAPMWTNTSAIQAQAFFFSFFYWCLTFLFWPTVTQRSVDNLLCSTMLVPCWIIHMAILQSSGSSRSTLSATITQPFVHTKRQKKMFLTRNFAAIPIFCKASHHIQLRTLNVNQCKWCLASLFNNGKVLPLGQKVPTCMRAWLMKWLLVWVWWEMMGQ